MAREKEGGKATTTVEEAEKGERGDRNYCTGHKEGGEKKTNFHQERNGPAGVKKEKETNSRGGGTKFVRVFNFIR